MSTESGQPHFTGAITAHRQLGRFFSEPVLLIVTGSRTSRGLVADETVVALTPRTVGPWLETVEATMDRYSKQEAEDIQQDLVRLCEFVLWPEFWPAGRFDRFMSLVYIQGSIVHTDCGVWAIHAADAGSTTSILNHPDLESMLQVTYPAERCLTHVLVGELHQTGALERREADLQFVGRALAAWRQPMLRAQDIYRVLNDRFVIRSWDNAEKEGFLTDLGHRIYVHDALPDYVRHYADVFHLCLARLTLIRPEEIARLTSPFLRAAGMLFVAKRVEELQRAAERRLVERGGAGSEEAVGSPLRDMLVRAAILETGANPGSLVSPELVSNWGRVLTHLAMVARSADGHPSKEGRLVNCALWCVAGVCADPISMIPDGLALEGNEEDWNALELVLRQLADHGG